MTPGGRAAAWRCILKFTLGSTSRGSAQTGAFYFWGRTTRVRNNIMVVLRQVGAVGERGSWVLFKVKKKIPGKHDQAAVVQ